VLYVSSQAHNIKSLPLSEELSLSFRGTVISGAAGDTTCKSLKLHDDVNINSVLN
jgi:hypothetical protein